MPQTTSENPTGIAPLCRMLIAEAPSISWKTPCCATLWRGRPKISAKGMPRWPTKHKRTRLYGVPSFGTQQHQGMSTQGDARVHYAQSICNASRPSQREAYDGLPLGRASPSAATGMGMGDNPIARTKTKPATHVLSDRPRRIAPMAQHNAYHIETIAFQNPKPDNDIEAIRAGRKKRNARPAIQGR